MSNVGNLEKSYEYLKKYYLSELTKKETIELLQTEASFNSEGSAHMYVKSFKLILRGEEYTLNISANAISIYLENIRNDFGHEILNKSITSIQKHLKTKPNKNIELVIKNYIN
ncbi:MAG: hypothetical protein E6538_08575 [Paeniclostridium sordellii]|nr:hypothetical protein [Paeniclostridium sordellii]